MILAKWVRPVCNGSSQRETQTVQHAAERGRQRGEATEPEGRETGKEM